MLDPRPAASPPVERELFVRQLVATRMAGVDPPESVIAQLTSTFREVRFRKKSVVYERGRHADWFYIIRAGAIELRRDGEPTWKLTDGSTIGILDTLIGRPYERDAVAIADTSCLAIRAQEYFEILEDHPHFSYAVMSFQASRLHLRQLEIGESPRPAQPSTWRLLRPGAADLGVVERALVLRKVAAFARSSIQALVSLAERARSESVPRAGVLFRQGEESGTFVAVASGEVSLDRGGAEVARRGPGELVEGLAAFAHEHRQYTATAVEPVVLITIEKDELFDRMEEHFELTRSVMAYVADEWERINRSDAMESGRSTLEGGW
jgi:CRP-like cAMP-binding protein